MKTLPTTTAAKTYTAEIIVWSKLGHCPLTNRTGSFCDVLVRFKGEVSHPSEAKAKLLEALATTEHADYGNYSVPEFPNQNIRTGYHHRA